MSRAAPANSNPDAPSWRARLFGIDVRSLAAFRIAVGVILLVDLAIRLGDLEAMYTDAGLMPLEIVRELYKDSLRMSLHWLNGSAEYQLLLFAIQGVAAFALLVGWKTRLATILSWVMLVSLHSRAPAVINGGDSFLRLLLFWAMFVPWGSCWSLDARRRAAKSQPPRGLALSMGTTTILMQVCLMYFMTALYKMVSPAWLDGTAVHDALAYVSYQRPLGATVMQYTELCRWLTHATIYLEFLGPLLVWIPWRNAQFRLAMMAAFVGLHLGVELTMYIGVFSWVSMASWLLFMPSSFWDRIARRSGKQQPEASQGVTSIYALPVWANVLCAFFLGYILFLNALSYANYKRKDNERRAATQKEDTSRTEVAARRGDKPKESAKKLKKAIKWWLNAPNSALMLHQNWAMFARLANVDGWYVGRATLKDGRRIDLLRGEAPLGEDGLFVSPERVSAMYPTHRWRKFFNVIPVERYKPFRKSAAEYYCRQYQATHDDRPEDALVLFELLRVRQPILDPDRKDLYFSHTYARLEFGTDYDWLDADLPY